MGELIMKVGNPQGMSFFDLNKKQLDLYFAAGFASKEDVDIIKLQGHQSLPHTDYAKKHDKVLQIVQRNYEEVKQAKKLLHENPSLAAKAAYEAVFTRKEKEVGMLKSLE